MKQTQKIVGVLLITSFLVSIFFSGMHYKSQITQYKFSEGQIVHELTTQYAKFAITPDGTLIKRVSYLNVISDFIVKYIQNIVVLMPIKEAQYNTYIYSEKIKAGLISLFGSLQKAVFFIVFVSIICVVSLLCSWKALLNTKMKELLFSHVKARIFIKNLSLQFNSPLA